MEFTGFRFGSGEFWVVFIEAAKGEFITSSDPKKVVIIETSPETFVFFSISKVPKKGIYILESYALRKDPKNGDPGVAFSCGESVEGIFIETNEFLLAEDEGGWKFIF